MQLQETYATYGSQIDALSEEVIAWFGGWLSADGSVKIADRQSRPCIRFVITERDPLDLFATLFGNRVFGPMPPSGLGRKDRWEWKISGWKAVLILKRVMPWLSARYAERAQEAIAGFVVRQDLGRRLTPAQVEAIKERLAVGRHGIGRQLAEEYGVTDGMISAIKSGRAWT